ncbi:MAG: cytochrome b/b6 domain-containing protein [Candidatus Coatesbacteria bacterium]
MRPTSPVPLYPGWLRGWHWTNAALFVALLATGFSMHFATPGEPLIPFRTARAVHNLAGVAILLLYAGFLAVNARSVNGRHYALRARGLVAGMIRQARWYLLGIFRGEPNPFTASRETKFNPLQRVTYLAVMYGWFPLVGITGLILLFPEAAPERVLGRGGIWPAAVLHALAAFAGALFLAAHVYLATTGNPVTEYYRSMLVGDHRPGRRSR